MLRTLLLALAALLFAAPAQAQIDIMAPFNQDAAMDSARVLAQDLPYADGDRKRLDIYGPNEIMEPAPDFPEDDRRELIQAMILADNDRDKAIELVEDVFERHPDDKAFLFPVGRNSNFGYSRLGHYRPRQQQEKK